MATELKNAQDFQDTEELTDQELNDLLKDIHPSKNSLRRYRGKLRLMDKIHNAIADKINIARQGIKTAYFRYEDDFIPEHKQNNHYELSLLARQSIIPNDNSPQ